MSFIHLEDLPKIDHFPGGKSCFVHTGHITIAYIRFQPGAVVQNHSHPHEQVFNALEGEFDFNLAGEVRRLKPGDVVVIPGNVEHTVTALGAGYVMDIFYPEREEFKQHA